MSRDYPDWIHPEKAASARRDFSGRVPVERLERLRGLVVEGEPGWVEFSLRFSHDEQGQIRIDVHVDAEVPLQCQRTLKTFQQALSSDSVVAVVGSEEEEAALPEDYEARLCPDDRLEVLDLVAEEVLLALPLVPVDPASEPMEAPAAEAETHRPFEALAALKKRSRQK
ncbi:YceD family protein [Wenzhouxiangella marina]|uniref:Large ribosomal RNA subunit accumulation protein YceD n=1 Tax=Wenzhouxiangella marina TaxID=1579979 RepID=A0A0K0XWE3_9GAMM|nr:YceD family protein [Wenzhouxiangella marina]AKS41936.1 hypothetical protein WM2015_1566 [Wenzhouxiangella marina]MBB6086297.1 uncharacterized protein [Wenzhouxiangella marina]